MARTTPIALSALALLTSACASYVDKPYQRIHVSTPGAKNAECILKAGKSKAIAHPPQKVTIRNNNKPLDVTCRAPGNRLRQLSFQPAKVESAKYNIATGYAPGMYYDYVEGSLHKYPEQVVVDFKGVEARPNPLPQYQYATAPAPRDAGIENFGPGRSLLSWEELSRSSSKNASSDSKNGESEDQSEDLRAPVPLPEKKDTSDVNASEQGQNAQSSAEPQPQNTKADASQNRSERAGTTESQSGGMSDSVGTVGPTPINPAPKTQKSGNNGATRTPSSFEARARQDARSANQKQPQSGRRENTRAIDRPTRLYSGD